MGRFPSLTRSRVSFFPFFCFLPRHWTLAKQSKRFRLWRKLLGQHAAREATFDESTRAITTWKNFVDVCTLIQSPSDARTGEFLAKVNRRWGVCTPHDRHDTHKPREDFPLLMLHDPSIEFREARKPVNHSTFLYAHITAVEDIFNKFQAVKRSAAFIIPFVVASSSLELLIARLIYGAKNAAPTSARSTIESRFYGTISRNWRFASREIARQSKMDEVRGD